MKTHIIYISGEDRRFMVLEGEVVRNRRKYPTLDTEHFCGQTIPVCGYDYDGNSALGNVIEDVSESGDSVVIMTDKEGYAHLENFSEHKGRKLTVQISDFDLSKKEIAKAVGCSH